MGCKAEIQQLASDTVAGEAGAIRLDVPAMILQYTEEMKIKHISEDSVDPTMENNRNRFYERWRVAATSRHVTIGPIRHQKHTQMGALQQEWQRGKTDIQEIQPVS